jgi:hypothetical protein
MTAPRRESLAPRKRHQHRLGPLWKWSAELTGAVVARPWRGRCRRHRTVRTVAADRSRAQLGSVRPPAGEQQLSLARQRLEAPVIDLGDVLASGHRRAIRIAHRGRHFAPAHAASPGRTGTEQQQAPDRQHVAEQSANPERQPPRRERLSETERQHRPAQPASARGDGIAHRLKRERHADEEFQSTSAPAGLNP